MKKTEMLKKNYEFKKVLLKGEFYSGKNIIAFILKNKSKKIFLGLAISTKIAKATKRNRIKRLIRENYKNVEDRVKPGYSMIFLWNKKVDAKEANFYKIKQDMLTIFDKAQILEKEDNYEKTNNINY